MYKYIYTYTYVCVCVCMCVNLTSFLQHESLDYGKVWGTPSGSKGSKPIGHQPQVSVAGGEGPPALTAGLLYIYIYIYIYIHIYRVKG